MSFSLLANLLMKACVRVMNAKNVALEGTVFALASSTLAAVLVFEFSFLLLSFCPVDGDTAIGCVIPGGGITCDGILCPGIWASECTCVQSVPFPVFENIGKHGRSFDSSCSDFCIKYGNKGCNLSSSVCDCTGLKHGNKGFSGLDCSGCDSTGLKYGNNGCKGFCVEGFDGIGDPLWSSPYHREMPSGSLTNSCFDMLHLVPPQSIGSIRCPLTEKH